MNTGYAFGRSEPSFRWGAGSRQDLFAGLTLALFALPQCMAYALLAGIEPKYGLYAFIVGSVVAALFGSSRHLQTGPVNAVSLIVASTMAVYVGRADLMPLVFLLTLLVGLLQLAAGLLRLGNLAHFISRSVMAGFIAAGGLLIIVNQLPNLLGMPSQSSVSILDGVRQILNRGAKVRFEVLALGVGTVGIVLLLNRLSPKSPTGVAVLPTYLLGILAAAVVVRWSGLESRGLRVIGDVPPSLPPVSLPPLDVSATIALLPGALAVAWIGLAEAISISKSVAALAGDRVDSDREFVGQGLANIAVSLFSGMPVSGSLTRTQLLYRAGAASRWANILAGLLVMAIVLLFAPLVRSIPVAALAGCLILIAVQMVDWKHVVMTLRATSADALAMLATFVTALFYALDTAVFVGIGVSLLLFLRHMQATHLSELIYDEQQGFRELGAGDRRPIPEISLVHLEGDLFFGAAETLEQEILRIAGREGLLVLILRMKRAYYIDATFIMVLLKLHAEMLQQGRLLLISGTTPETERTLRQAGVLAAIGAENVFPSTPVLFQATGRALACAVEYVNQKLEKDCCYS